MNEQLKTLFGFMSNPVVIEAGGEVSYKNSAAAALPEAAIAGAVEIFQNSGAESASAMKIESGDTAYMVHACTVSDTETAYVFSACEPETALRENAVVSAVAEAIRDPLAVLSLSANFIIPTAERTGDERTVQYAAMMNKSLYRLRRLANHLNVFTCAEDSDFGMVKTVFDLACLCEETTLAVRSLLGATEQGIALRLCGDSVMVRGDRVMLRRMLLTIISNSVVFAAGEDMRICISVKKSRNMALITVTDNGEGICLADKTNVWSHYLDRREFGDTYRGAGFGLPMAYVVARAHGGGAVLESRPGLGTSVIISLPVSDEKAAELKSDSLEYGLCAEYLTELADILPPERFLEEYLD
ncbi:MAG: HAMP domain-containing histidine kinase [Oscillospiraceae bacterium]|nr:HAMP domain-containing histidine kinase [Oscillospiraceae bacterium]